MADDPLAKWRALDDAPATNAAGGAGGQAAPEADPLAKWRELDAAPAGDDKAAPAAADVAAAHLGAANTKMRSQAPVVQPGGLAETAKAALYGSLKDIPIVGQPLDTASTKLAGFLRSKLYGDVTQAEAEKNIQANEDATLAAHPIAEAVGGMAGTTLAMAPLGATAAGAKLLGLTGPSLAARMGAGGLSGAVIGGADAGIRSDGDLSAIRSGAETGGLFGVVAPGAGDLIGRVGNKLFGAIKSPTPEASAGRSILESANASGKTSADFNRLFGDNPGMAPVDVDAVMRARAQGFASEPGAPQALIDKAVKARQAMAAGNVKQAFDDQLGPADPGAALSYLRAKQAASEPLSADATRTAFTDAMGAPADPHAAMEALLQKRSADAGPLYDKALNRPIQWDNRLQQFVDDPIVQSGIAKGVEVQRLEALAAGKRFDPNDYAVSVDANGKATIGPVPNMKTLSVVKEGLDAMVDAETDQTTGRLTKQGRAIDQVRKALLDKLDEVNPDYKAARQAWAGPSRDRQAFEMGTKDFQGGSTNIKTSPEALQAWMARASDSEKEQRILGARTGLEMQMRGAADPAAKAQAIAAIDNNRQKLAALMGKDEANSLIQRLTTKYGDPVGGAFTRGLNLFRNRAGEAGVLEDDPAALREWWSAASDNEKEAARVGVRSAARQAIGSGRNGALKGESVAMPEFNREKLETILGKDEAASLIKTLKNEHTKASVNADLTRGSMTAVRLAAQAANKVNVPQIVKPNLTAVGLAESALTALPQRLIVAPVAKAFGGARNRITADALMNPEKFTRLLGKAERAAGRRAGASRAIGNAATLAIRGGSAPANRLFGSP